VILFDEGAKMAQVEQIQARRFGRVNWLGMYTLARREIRRFVAVWTQTLLAPLVTAGLFLLIFNLAIGPMRGDVNGMPFVAFLAPGILMMTVMQNAFANTSSSLVIAKVQGNIVDTLMPPLSASEMVFGYLAGAIARGVFVAVAITLAMIVGLGIVPAHIGWLLVFVTLGGGILGGLGIIAGIFANKFDHMAAITNFVITPLSFLSGTFYSIEILPPAMQVITRFNPMFYLIDGARYGVIGASDANVYLGLIVCLGVLSVIVLAAWRMFKTGYRLKP